MQLRAALPRLRAALRQESGHRLGARVLLAPLPGTLRRCLCQALCRVVGEEGCLMDLYAAIRYVSLAYALKLAAGQA